VGGVCYERAGGKYVCGCKTGFYQSAPDQPPRVAHECTAVTVAPTAAPTPQATAAPVDCVVTPFTPWSACSHECGGGLQIRFRRVLVQPAHGGAVCPALQTRRDCNTKKCAVHCDYTWGAWGPCSLSCGKGTQTRVAKITRAPQYGGTACPETSDRQCNAMPCLTQPPQTLAPTPPPTPAVVDCVVTDWSLWSVCSEKCNGGLQMRFRGVKAPPSGGGAACPKMRDVRNCNTKPCPVHCDYTWNPWTQCTLTCGGGIQAREVTVASMEKHGGKACPTREERVCNSSPCPTTVAPTPVPTPAPVDCVVSDWSHFSLCSEECGSGVQMRFRRITRPAKHGGKGCPQVKDAKNCNDHACAVHCKFQWGPWSACSKTCGVGTKNRAPVIKVYNAHGGDVCPKTEEMLCEDTPCPTPAPTPRLTLAPTPFRQDCQMSTFSAWSLCSEECGSGVQMRFRGVIPCQGCRRAVPASP
jgi:hypothetical protein